MVTRLEPGRYLGRTLQRYAGRSDLCVVASSYAAGTQLPAHEHERAHLCVVLAGRYAEQIGSRRFERGPLDVVWYPAGTGHAELHATAGRHLIVDVDAERAASAPMDVRSVEDPTAAPVALRLASALTASDPDADLDREALVVELVASAERPERPRGIEPRWLRDVDAALTQHFRSPLRLAELAAIGGVDATHLARTWRRCRGETIGQSVRRRRILHVCRRLYGERTPISAIALEAGFADQSHLGRVFRRLVGSSPARFRREYGRS